MSTADGLIMVGSWNAGPAVERAAMQAARGTALLDAVVEGIGLIEDDPEEMSVGYGGLPNEAGVVELDAAVMDGRTHKAGAVAGLKGVRHAAKVALNVLRRTDHALLVGEGALAFARQCGFKEEDLLTAKAREAWLAWKASLSTRDAWIGPDDETTGFGGALWAGHKANPTPGGPPTPSTPAVPAPGRSGGAPKVPFTFGTVHVSALNAPGGDLCSCTSTSGLSYKIPGRAGDTPVIGAGLYTDNAVGSAGCTGRGEATVHNCSAFHAVVLMESGMSATEAALGALKRLVSRTIEARLLSAPGRPGFNVTLYALRKDGDAGAASVLPGYTYVRWRGGRRELLECPSVFPS
ncbi:MAG: isoaspartyl peptidase/L-asparaginase [Planctomycetes bacterium]|nr:isoaspartyl peptidase/L-asparaginase [Planctomycetota bacterium]